MAPDGNHTDVSSTLGALERKLRELEDELSRVGRPAPEAVPEPPAPAPPAVTAVPDLVPEPPASTPPPIFAAPPRPAPVPPPVAPAPPAPEPRAVTLPDEQLQTLEAQLDDLRRYGAELHESAERLLTTYRQALAELDAAPAPVAPAPPAPTPLTAVASPGIGQGQQVPDDLLERFRAAQAEHEAGEAAAARQAAADAETARIAAAQATQVALAREAADAAARAEAARAAAAAAAPPAPAPPAFVPAPAVPEPAAAPLAAAPPAPHAESIVPAAHAAVLSQEYLGAMTVDAGPFVDIASLTGFEQALARVPGVRDVYVRGFQGQRAIIDVDFAAPTALVPELAAVTPVPFTVNGADATGLVVTIHGAVADA